MVINRLDTSTAFAATIDSNQGVFIPAKVAASLNVQVGERFTAILIENTAHPDKTPWMAIRITRLDPAKDVQTLDELARMILADLNESGSATVEDVAESISHPIALVVGKMQEMARGGMIKRKTFYAIDEADFYDGDE
jgi:bifunctional DNA-binding transcriptional regulator/antitoxin component of YhaV-PrlF toxin-antitoxin module